MVEDLRRASHREFGRVLAHSWGSLMSGAASVPVAAMATYSDGWERALWAGSAVLFIYVAAYKLWARERDRAVALAEKLAPSIRLEFGDQVPGSIVQTKFNDGRPAIFFRIKVTHAGRGILPRCTGHLIAVERDGTPTNYADSLQLTWAPAQGPNPLEKDIRDGVPEYLDACFVKEPALFGLATLGFNIPISIFDLLNRPGEYTLKVAVSSPTAVSSMIAIVIHYTGDWGTSTGWVAA